MSRLNNLREVSGLDNAVQEISRLDPKDIRLTQSDASPFFSKGGKVDELIIRSN
jgi:hypothetical protein